MKLSIEEKLKAHTHYIRKYYPEDKEVITKDWTPSVQLMEKLLLFKE